MRHQLESFAGFALLAITVACASAPTLGPIASGGSAAASGTPAASATAESGSATPAPSASATPTGAAAATRTAAPVPTQAPPTCAANCRITGRVTLVSGQPQVTTVNLYRAEDGAWLGGTNTDAAGRFTVSVASGGAYKLFFVPINNESVKAEWWNDKPSIGGATPIPIAGQDVTGLTVVLAP